MKPRKSDVGSKDSLSAPELVFGIVAAMGTELEDFGAILTRQLERFGYRTIPIRLIRALEQFGRFSKIPISPVNDRLTAQIKHGDKFRRQLNRQDALALLGITKIAEERQGLTRKTGVPSIGTAYFLRSLKTPLEISALRRVYGRNCYIISAFAPKEHRVQTLAQRILDSHTGPTREENYRAEAESLVRKDETENDSFGQNVREAFPMADFFVDVTDAGKLQQSVERIIELLFGNPFHTPTRDEYCMFQATAAALRSAGLGRQVGAAIASADGDIIALGCNEVPKAGGGMYWAGEPGDSRDHVLKEDSNDKIKAELMRDFLHRLHSKGWMSKEKTELPFEKVFEQAMANKEHDGIGKARLMNIIEYGRAVHAEMAAITDAARRGVSIKEATLYTTTFPCHNCTKHIVASGISRVVYVEPYPKSRATELHSDAIVVDDPNPPANRVRFDPFVGIAPRKYLQLFSVEDVRKKDGRVFDFNERSATLRRRESPVAYLQAETIAIYEFRKALVNSGITLIDEKKTTNKVTHERKGLVKKSVRRKQAPGQKVA